MKPITAVAGAIFIAASSLSFAAAPVLSQSKSVTINAPVAKVWDAAKDFNALNTWHPAVETDKISEGTNNQVGAVRVLTLKGGGTIKEKLVGFDAATHTFKYQILEGVLPVTSYTSTFTVKAAGEDKSEVTWAGDFKRKDVGDKPADDANDKTALDTVAGVYQSGLDNLKKVVEAK
jgi:mxaD protein